MIMIVFFLFTYFIFILFDLMPIYKKKQWKLFWVYSMLIFIAIPISILIGLEVKIPSPAEPIKKMIMAVWGLK